MCRSEKRIFAHIRGHTHTFISQPERRKNAFPAFSAACAQFARPDTRRAIKFSPLYFFSIYMRYLIYPLSRGCPALISAHACACDFFLVFVHIDDIFALGNDAFILYALSLLTPIMAGCPRHWQSFSELFFVYVCAQLDFIILPRKRTLACFVEKYQQKKKIICVCPLFYKYIYLFDGQKVYTTHKHCNWSHMCYYIGFYSCSTFVAIINHIAYYGRVCSKMKKKTHFLDHMKVRYLNVMWCDA